MENKQRNSTDTAKILLGFPSINDDFIHDDSITPAPWRNSRRLYLRLAKQDGVFLFMPSSGKQLGGASNGARARQNLHT
jgi:hypothetical protein